MYWVDSGEAGQFLPVTDVPEKAILSARVASSQRSRLFPRKRSRRRPRGVVDTSVLLAGVAGFRNVGHNASASLLKRWISDNTFIWLISEDILDEYKEVLARQKVRRELIGRIINLLREEASLVPVKRTEMVSPDPGEDPICACAEEGGADFIVTLNPRDFPQGIEF